MTLKKNILFLLLTTFNFNILPVEVKPSIKVNSLKQEKKNSIRSFYNKISEFFKFNKEEKLKLINKNFSDLTFEDLEHNRKYYITNNTDKETLARNLERMLSLCKDQDKICNIRLELADVYFDSNKLDKAATSYKEFVKLYPGNNMAEYASYKEILSNFKESLDFDRDQTKTKEALSLSENFVTKSKNKEHLKEIKQVIRDCKKKLLKAEINMFYFYLRKPNYKAAQKRLDYLKKDFFKKPENEILTELQEHLKLAQEKKEYQPLDLDSRDAQKKSKVEVKKKKSYVEIF